MQDQDFFDFLDENGIAYKEVSRSIVLKSCPECGNDNWKVHLFREREDDRKSFYGKCYRNDCRWSSYRYLIAMGIDEDEVRDLHGHHKKIEEGGLEFDFVLEDQPTKRRTDDYTPQAVSTADFFHIEDWPSHPAAKYAVSRGYVPALAKKIMIDPQTNSMVYLCHEGDMVCGWQKRFVKPSNPKMKTLNPPGDIWKKSHHVLEYPGQGDLCVVEGPSTCLSAYHFGFYGVCTFGAAISSVQLETIAGLAEKTKKKIGVAFDTDFAGVNGYYRIRNFMSRRGIEVYRIKPEQGNDLNDSWQAGKSYTVVKDDDQDSTIPTLSGELFEEFYK